MLRFGQGSFRIELTSKLNLYLPPNNEKYQVSNLTIYYLSIRDLTNTRQGLQVE